MTNSRHHGRLRRDLRAIQADGVAFSLMVGLGETYIPAFALALGLGEITAGLVVAIPLLAGAVLQLAAPALIRRLGSLRRWVVLCAAVQAASFVPLVAAAAAGRLSAAALFLIATVYWAAGLGTGPAWNTWVGRLVPGRLRARFFARRSRQAQVSVLLGVVAGGAALHLASAHDVVLVVFAVLFLLACLCRTISVAFLARQSEPRDLPQNHRAVSARDLLRRARSSADGRLLLYMVLVQAAVQVSGPFFTPYMLGQLSFSYAQYLLLIATAFGAKVASLPAIGLLAHRFGAQRVLFVSGVCIVPLSALWICSDSLGYLLVVQLVAGAIWAAYELATFLLLFERIDESERTSVLTMFNLANALATVGGALVGAALLGAQGLGATAYHVIFGCSSAARVVTLLFLVRLGRGGAQAGLIATRPLGVRPNTGSIDAPIVVSLPEETPPQPADGDTSPAGFKSTA
jgi:MFS family permease